MADDILPSLTGNMSYIEFAQAMINNRNILNDIYEPTFNKQIFQIQDQLKEIAAQDQG